MPAGEYNVVVVYLGDSKVNANRTSKAFTVVGHVKQNTTIVPEVVEDNNNVTITVGVNENATGFVKFTMNGNELFAEVKEGKAIVNVILPDGNYTIVASYLGDENYNMNSTSETFTIVGHVKKDTAILAVPNVDGNTVSISIDVDKNATGYVVIGILGQNFVVPVENGKAVFSYDFVPGSYSANMVYFGDDNFNNATTTATFTVIQNDSNLKNTTIDVDVQAVENDVTITASVDSSASGLVEFSIRDKSVYIAVNKGKAVYNTNLPAGEYMWK